MADYESVDLKSVNDGDRLQLDDDTVLQVGDYITWEPDGVHIEGVVNGAPRTVVLDKDSQVRRLTS